MYDELFNPIKVFNSIDESRNYIIDNELYTSTDLRNYYRLLHKSFDKGNIAYGHRWQLASDLVYEDKIFRTKFDKEAYIQGKPAYQPEGKKYWVVEGALKINGIENKQTIHIEYTCICCGKKN